MATNFISIFNGADLSARKEEIKRDEHGVFANFLELPTRVKYYRAPDEIQRIKLEMLGAFPNFAEATALIFKSLAVCALSKTKGVHISPTLLVGPPGVGKTFYMSTLCKALGVPRVAIDLSVTTGSMAISGMNSRWGNSAPGLIAKALMTSKVANQVVTLDELDKSQSYSGTTSGPLPATLSALLSLLETHSAKSFKDEWLEFPIDASNLSYIATANDVSSVPDFILSRFQVVHIQELSAAELSSVTATTYKNLLTELELEEVFPSNVSMAVRTLLSSLGDVRKLKAGLMSGLAICADRGGKSLTARDVADYVSKVSQVKQDANRSIGFH